MSEFPSFLRLHDIPYITFYLSINPFMTIWVAFTPLLLWIMLWIKIYKYSHIYIFFLFFLFEGCTHCIWRFRGQGSNRSCSCWPLWNPNHICDLYHSSWQSWILNPLIEVRDQTRTLLDAPWVCNHWATTGTPDIYIYIFKRIWNLPYLGRGGGCSTCSIWKFPG